MNGAHDLGGAHGFGPVIREGNDEAHHAAWEKRAQAIGYVMTRAGVYNIDEFRFARESMPPAHYLAARYFERTLFAIEKKLVEKGIVATGEVSARARELAGAADKVLRQPGETMPSHQLQRFLPLRRALPRVSLDTPPRFAPGDGVVTRKLNPQGHTRLPRYARGRHGVIDRLHGPQVFPDASARGLGRQPEYLYSVRFTARELWGEDSDPNSAVHLDLWESYLEPL
ncbi:MAG: nitrile hydratase subunit beta [Burkholderiales bacterium]|nr:nitrile hydratase subunit beta [Burkholderiales bacterium]